MPIISKKNIKAYNNLAIGLRQGCNEAKPSVTPAAVDNTRSSPIGAAVCH